MSVCRGLGVKSLGPILGIFSIMLFMCGMVQADTLTIMDGTDTWTLNVDTNCTTCSVTLQVIYGNLSSRAGLYLDSIQWSITDPNVSPDADPKTDSAATIDAMVGFYATNAGVKSDWDFTLANLNANQCGGGSGTSTCGEYIVSSTAGGYGPVVSGSTLSWSFNTTFDSTLPASLSSGNIRAAYNDEDGKSAGIFSPGGGSFEPPCPPGECGGPIPTPVPEPTSLLMLGAGLVGLGWIARRNKK